MSYFPRKKKIQLRPNFQVPPTNVVDLRRRQARHSIRSPKHFASYFETEHQEKNTMRFWHGFWHEWRRRQRFQKEQKYSRKLTRFNEYQLDPHAQRLLLEIQKHRLHFAEHQDADSLRALKYKYRELQKVVNKKPDVVTEMPAIESTPFPQKSLAIPHGLFKKTKSASPPLQPKPQPVVAVIEEPDIADEPVEPSPLFARRFFAFTAWSVVVIAPLIIFGWLYPLALATKGQVLGASTQGVKYLESAGSSLIGADFNSAGSDFVLAQQQFSQAEATLKRLSVLFRLIPVKGEQGVAAQHIVSAGKYLSEAGQYINQAAATLSTVRLETSDDRKQQGFTTSLLLANTQIRPAVTALEKARDEVLTVKAKDLPAEYRQTFTELHDGLPRFVEQLKNGLAFSDVLLKVFGHDNPQRYLVLFQNNQELRPTGGFIGSVAVMKIDRGVIRDLEVPEGGVYDISGQLVKKVIAPEPLHLVNPHWNLQDAGWFPDVPTSARKIMWFYTSSGGPTVDGIFFMTPEVVSRLLEITGPIYLEERKIVVDKNNFLQLIAEEKEMAKDTSQPKAIIAELTPLLLNQALQRGTEQAGQVLAALEDLLSERDIMFFFRDESLQTMVQDLDWAGQLKQSDRDYFHLSHTNISGGKTDRLMEERVEHTSEILPDGRIIDRVKVTRAHRGSAEDEQEGVRNLSYLRFYVPQGSKLVEARGFSRVDPKLFLSPDQQALVDEDLRQAQGEVFIDEYSGTRISQEFDKSVFGNWAAVEAGESVTVEIRYELPFSLKVGGFFDQFDHYSLLVQKQPGQMPFIFRSSMIFPDGWKVWWYGPQDDLNLQNSQLIFEDVLRGDWHGGVVVGPEKN